MPLIEPIPQPAYLCNAPGYLVSNNTTFVAGRAYFSKIFAPRSVTIVTMQFYLSTVGTDGDLIEIGLYNRDGTKLTSTASVDVYNGGAAGLISVNITDTGVPAGNFWVAIGGETTSGTPKCFGAANGGNLLGTTFHGYVTSGGSPLPATVPSLTAIGNIPAVLCVTG